MIPFTLLLGFNFHRLVYEKVNIDEQFRHSVKSSMGLDMRESEIIKLSESESKENENFSIRAAMNCFRILGSPIWNLAGVVLLSQRCTSSNTSSIHVLQTEPTQKAEVIPRSSRMRT